MTRPIELVLKNTSQRANILVTDASGVATDASDGPHLTVLDRADNVILKDSYPSFSLTGTVSVSAGTAIVTGTGTDFLTELTSEDTVTIAGEPLVVKSIQSKTQFTARTNHVAGASGASATKQTRIIKPGGSTGQYYILWGDSTAPSNLPDQTETNSTGDKLLHWRATPAAGAEEINVVQVLRIVSANMLSLLPSLRRVIDKAAKDIDEDPTDPCYLGYSDWMLIDALQGGLGLINAFQPYPIWRTVDEFPSTIHGRVLIDAAFLDLLISQEVFAIDTDVNYSDQGNVFVIDHYSKLASMVNETWQRLTQIVPLMKRQYVSSGSLHVKMGPSARFQQIIDAAPPGTTFRNFWVA